MNKKLYLCVSSCGGHFFQIKKIMNLVPNSEKCFVINDKIKMDGESNEIINIFHAERNIFQLINLFEAIIIIFKKKPKIIISTGASPAIPFFIWAKILRIKTIYIESMSRVTELSLTGKIAIYMADYFFVQWAELKQKYPKTIFMGNIIE